LFGCARHGLVALMEDGQRVLVVDDHTDAAELLCMQLVRLGHDCQDAKDGAGALELARVQKPHVAIVDLWLPDMSGHELARGLRALDPAVFLIALTGSTRPEDRVRAVDAGFDEYLMKPTDGGTLRELLAKARRKRAAAS
jgi:DNA-binding response OmpR family regulator